MRNYLIKLLALSVFILIQKMAFCQPNINSKLLPPSIKYISISNTPAIYSVTNKDSLIISIQGLGDSAKIISYDVTIGADGLLQSTNFNGFHFAEHIRQYVHSLRSGNSFSIENIKFREAGNKHMNIAPGITVHIL